MAVFPPEAHGDSLNAQDRPLQRWPLLAVAFLFLLFSTLPGIVRGADLWRSLQPTGSSADGPYFAKREPLRALAAVERRDGQAGGHAQTADGILVPAALSLASPRYALLGDRASTADICPIPFWPGPLPRAPPRTA